MRRPFLFLAISLAAHGLVGVGALVGASGSERHASPTETSSLKSDTETELPLAEAAGETEVDPEKTTPESLKDVPTDPGNSLPSPPTSPAVPQRATRPQTGAPGAGAGAAPGLIGAVGEPGAVEVETAFLRALPQVASFDHDWNKEPIGATFAATITVEVDPSGHLAQITGTSSSTPLNRAVERALGQLKPRLLTAHAPRTRITVTCTVHTDEVHDGWHGDVFALGASANGRGGTGFVSLATGRRVDFVVSAR